MQWDILGIMLSILGLWVSILAMGMPMLSRLSACVASLADLKERWHECRELDQAAHEVFREELDDHEERIVDLEDEEESTPESTRP
jgi:hypothetical protein